MSDVGLTDWREWSREDRRAFVDGVADRHGLRRCSDGGVLWSEAAAAEVFERAGMLLSVWPGTSQKPSLGVCLVCGQPCKPRLWSVLDGRGVCNSNRCSGRQLPPAEIVLGKLAARGFEVVGDLPASQLEVFTLRHTGKDYLRGSEVSCGQTFSGTWKELIGLSNGCAVCAGQQIAVGFNDLAFTDPHLVDRFVFPHEAMTVTRSSRRCVQLWCAAEGCSNAVEQRVADLSGGHAAQCGAHQPYAWSRPQFHYAIPAWSVGGDFVGSVYGHTADEFAVRRLREHLATAERHGLVLGDVVMQPAGDKAAAAKRDWLPFAIESRVSIPTAVYGDEVIASKWDGWINESVAGLWPEEVLASLSSGDDGWLSSEQVLIQQPIAALL